MGEGQAIKDALNAATVRLAAAGFAEAGREARAILAALLGNRSALYGAGFLTAEQSARFSSFVERRAAHEPLGRILGQREFWSLSFQLSPQTLEPRPESETLVEAVLRQVDRAAPLRLLDLGTGSGCLILALLSELPKATAIAVDRDQGALTQAEKNAAALGLKDRVRFVLSDWGAALDESFDVIVSNPPYIATVELAELAPEVRLFDPRLALDGGPDGLAAYRALLPDARRLLRSGGLLALEIGFDQAGSVSALVQAAGFAQLRVQNDLAGQARVVLAGG